MTIYGHMSDGTPVYKATEIGGHCHSDVEQYVAEALSQIEPLNGSTFIRASVDLGRTIGLDNLVETNSNSVIAYAKRGNRAGETRFVLNQPAQETSILNVILCIATEAPFENKWVLVTAFSGSLGEREPFDTNLTEEAKAKAESFWATHALVPTDEERAIFE